MLNSQGQGLNEPFPGPMPFWDSMVLRCRFLKFFTKETRHWFPLWVENVKQVLRNARVLFQNELSIIYGKRHVRV